MRNDPFLEADHVRTETDAMAMSLVGALQRNKTYRDDLSTQSRDNFRADWARLVRQESPRYQWASISDVGHCEVIQKIADILSGKYADMLVGGRLKFGASQKALNLYLKYTWRLGIIKISPPHCPIDSIILAAGGIIGSWSSATARQNICHGCVGLER